MNLNINFLLCNFTKYDFHCTTYENDFSEGKKLDFARAASSKCIDNLIIYQVLIFTYLPQNCL